MVNLLSWAQVGTESTFKVSRVNFWISESHWPCRLLGAKTKVARLGTKPLYGMGTLGIGSALVLSIRPMVQAVLP